MRRIHKLTTAELVASRPTPDDLARLPRHPIFALLDDVRSLENVGLIFRLCDAALVETLYLCGITGYPPLPSDDPRPPWVAERAGRVIGKTAIRTVQYVPWQYRPSAFETVRELKQCGVQIVALEQTAASIPYTVGTYRFPVCAVLGHERVGVSDAVLSESDLIVHIPTYGIGNSLNVATAFAIVVYELLRCCLRGET